MVEKNNTSQVIVTQGCWASSDNKETCTQGVCIGEETTRSPNLRFCCCTGDLCNANFTNADKILSSPESVISSGQAPPLAPSYSLFDSPIVWICITLGGMFASFVGYVTCRVAPKAEPESAPLAPSGPGYSSNLYNVDNLKLVSMIGRGK